MDESNLHNFQVNENEICSDLVWNGQLILDRTESKIVYVSNKEKLNTYSVFLYDIENREERLLKSSDEYSYFTVAWLDDNTVLCYKLHGRGTKLVAIDIDGLEQELF